MHDHTVIASIHGMSLYLLPVLDRPVDRARLGDVLGRHGHTLLPGAGRTPEFIAAQALSPSEAAALAHDLREIGLTARVVPRGGLTISRRASQAWAFQLTVLMGLLAAGAALLPGLVGLSVGALVAGGVVLALVALWGVNALSMVSRGGTRLELASAAPDPEARQLVDLVAGLAALSEALPEHIAEPMMTQARALARRAQLNPEGHAAAALRDLATDLRREQDAADLQATHDLRRRMEQARLAARELEGPG